MAKTQSFVFAGDPIDWDLFKKRVGNVSEHLTNYVYSVIGGKMELNVKEITSSLHDISKMINELQSKKARLQMQLREVEQSNQSAEIAQKKKDAAKIQALNEYISDTILVHKQQNRFVELKLESESAGFADIESYLTDRFNKENQEDVS